jgi:predicted PolB exonuclease-like 3'-5' exonuclease
MGSGYHTAMARPRKLLVFDLETIPDVALARKVWDDKTAGLDDMAVTQLIWDVHREKSGGRSDFPSLPFHKIVAIGCLVADIEGMETGGESFHFKSLGCIGGEGDDEPALVKKWFDYCEKAFSAGQAFRLVGFNSQRFDMPCLQMRALKYGLTAPWLFNSGGKWDGYKVKARGGDPVWNCDLLEMVGEGNALKLDEVCTLVGLPGKLDVEGSKVAEMMARGEVKQVRDYCETDVLNTYLLYIRHQKMVGNLAPEALAREEQAVREWLAKESPGKAHLESFAKAWPEVKMEEAA